MTDAVYYDLTRGCHGIHDQVCPTYPEIGDYYDVDNPPDVGCTGDINLDGNVTVADMLAVLSEFGCTQSCASDVNADGVVTVTDVLALLGLFGTPCL